METVIAGPCGTSACAPAASSFTWTLIMVWPHLAHYYATRPLNPYPKFGPKKGGGNGKAALWHLPYVTARGKTYKERDQKDRGSEKRLVLPEAQVASFLAALAAGAAVGEAAALADLPVKRCYWWRQHHEEFAAAWDEALSGCSASKQ